MASWATTEVSPFIFDGPLPPEAVIGRQQEADVLRAWARAGRFVSLYGPRRYGKTSLIGKVAWDASRDDEMPVIVVDLYGVLSFGDLAVRLERAYRNHAHGQLRAAVTAVFKSAQLGLSLAGAGLSLQFARGPHPDPVPALHALLDLPRAIQGRYQAGRVLVVFDEFQALLAVEGAEALVRSHIQHHRDVASYVFAGSEPGLLAAVFTDRARPFYSQVEPKRLGRLSDAALAAAIDDAFTATQRSTGDMLPGLLATAEGHPQRAMLLAHCLWSATPEHASADDDIWARALEEVMARTVRESETLWRGLGPNEQRVLRAVVQYGSPYRKDALVSTGLAKGTAADVVERLVATGDLERDAGRLRVVDPLLARWVQTRFGDDG